MRDRTAVLVFGFGKSGTKRLLRILDLSPETHCRNEPYNHRGSPWQELRKLPRGTILEAGDGPLLDAEWDAALDWCRERMGERDRLPPPPKRHLYAAARRLGGLHLLGSRTVRNAAGRLLPAYGHDEWLLPRWAGNRSCLARARLVLKINQSPAFAAWVLRHRPSQTVLHIVRHPGAVLHSWSKRLLELEDPEQVRRDSIARLALIARTAPGWAERFGPLESLCVEEAELLFWLYVAEVTHEAGRGQDQYHLVHDEDVFEDPERVARRVYAACGLAFGEAVEEELAARAPEWRACAAPWRELVEARHHAMVERILERSSLRERWSDDQIVSGIDYA